MHRSKIENLRIYRLIVAVYGDLYAPSNCYVDNAGEINEAEKSDWTRLNDPKSLEISNYFSLFGYLAESRGGDPKSFIIY